MKILKLVFICHGWHLGFFKTPLVKERIEAWKYGPVIPSLYRYFKEYGSNPIPPSENEILPELPADVPDSTQKLMERVWEKYSPLSASQLSSLTHRQESPWYEATDGGTSSEKDIIISNKVIEEFYSKKVAA